MTTQNYSNFADIIVPTNDNFTYRGLEGDDTYILTSDSNAKIDIIDTDGNNIIQLPEWSKIKSVIITSDAVRLTCDDMTVFTINGADKFSYDIGGNKTNNEIGKISSFSEFANLFGLEIPTNGQTKSEDDKIVYEDKLAELYTVEVKKEENGNKYYINGELSPNLNFSSNNTYVFDQNDSSTSKHPLSISITKNGTHEGGVSVDNIKFYANGYNKTENEYSDIFSNDNTFDNAFVVLNPSIDDTQLYYYCLFHSGMANESSIIIDNFNPVSIAATFDIANNGAQDFIVLGKNDPTIILERGKTYEFKVDAPGHPFLIKSIQSTGNSDLYSEGVTNNGASNGIIKFTVPNDAPGILYYNCQFHLSMAGEIRIYDNNVGGELVKDVTQSDDSSSGSNDPGNIGGGGGYGYYVDISLEQNIQDFPPVYFDI
tara:strand:- start:243 stop:1526 length:1284 start_codon:yes stop_codon:yes gene_type:complete